jgi:hypothetical protein
MRMPFESLTRDPSGCVLHSGCGVSSGMPASFLDAMAFGEEATHLAMRSGGSRDLRWSREDLRECTGGNAAVALAGTA